ncbi:MAG: type I-F CRISPR-associated endoribonuclease Cas6/Csy4 [Gammaproteobacteria bacterium]|nr:type I-F CRISPR-associated endoribonuclease Cas6/Csy4 [Gammaproteobacteria bacterium]
MDHYVEFSLRQDPEFTPPVLMGALFSKLHRALVVLEADDIGVSFPRYQLKPRSLGTILRLHGKADRLCQLLALDWLAGMRDFVDVGLVAAVPHGVKHRVVHRVQPKTSVERLRRRHARRHQVSLSIAEERIPDSVLRPVALPFANVRSQSTGQTFSLFIGMGKLLDEPIPGTFSRYGLATDATVPWF